MVVSKTPQECLEDLNKKENQFKDYETRWDSWNKKINKLKDERQDIINKINTRDEALLTRMINEFTNNNKWVRIGGCTLDDRCKLACEVEYVDKYTTTPMGRGFHWFNKNFGDNSKYKVGDDSSCHVLGMDKRKNYCYCQIPNDNGTTYILNEKEEIYKLINKNKNEIQPAIDKVSADMPLPFPITLECCLNQIDCKNGKCEGNLQVCRTTITNSIGSTEYTQNELNNYNNIQKISISIDDILKEINSLSNDIYNESYKIYSIINKKNNIQETLQNLNSIYEQVKISFNKVEEIIKKIIQMKNDAIKYNDTTRNNSIYKYDVQNSLELINKKINNINNSVSIINSNYIYVKNTYDSIEKQFNDINLLNLNKGNIINYIKLINNDINSINSFYEAARILTISSNKDLISLYNLFDNAQNLISNINITKNDLNKFYTTFTNLFTNFSKDSDYYNIALLINNDIKDNILNINNNITEVNNTLKNINDIYILKKDIYESNLINEEQYLIKLNKIKAQEEENKNINFKSSQQMPMVVPMSVPASAPVPMTVIENDNKKKDEERVKLILSIVIPIAVLLIIAFFYFMNRKKINNNNNNNNNI